MKVLAFVFFLLGTSSVSISQSYYTFNDSVTKGWNVQALSLHSFGGEYKMLLKYSHPETGQLFPAIATFKNNKIIVGRVLNDQAYNNLFEPVQRPDGRILLPTTTISQNRKFYYNLVVLEKDGSPMNELNVTVNPNSTLAGGIYELGKNKWVDIQTIQKSPDNPGQQAFYNVWFQFFDFAANGSNRTTKSERTIKSSFNEEVLAACAGNDSAFYILVRRYTKKDFSEYKGILYALSMQGDVRWNKEFDMDKFTTTTLIADTKGVLLAVNTIYGAFLFPNSSMLTYYGADGKEKASALIDKFITNTAIRNKAGQLVLGGACYVVDSSFMKVVKKPKLLLANSTNLKIIGEDMWGQYDGTDGELTMMQFPTSCEINAMKENKDGTLLLLGSVFKPADTKSQSRQFHALIMNADAKGKIKR